MHHLTGLLLCCCLIGCSDAGPTVAYGRSETPPPEVLAAWTELDTQIKALSSDISSAGGNVSSYLREENGGYIVALEFNLQPPPIHGGGVVLNPAHTRKSEALWYTQLLLYAFTEQVNQAGAFSRLDCASEVNGVIVNISIPLPLTDNTPLTMPRHATIELHDPYDGNTFTWPESGDPPDSGPDHWCFRGTSQCSICKSNSVLYSPYADEYE